MKILALAVLLTVMQAPPPVPRKAANPNRSTAHSTTKNSPDKEQVASQEPVVQKTVPTETAKDKGSQVQDDHTSESIRIGELPPVSVRRDWIDCLAIFLSGALVLVGGYAVRAAYRTLGQIKRQGDKMEETRGVMADQLMTMQGQLKEMAGQTKVMGDSVAVARETLEMAIKKERARLWISVSALTLSSNVFKDGPPITYTISIYGLSEAFIRESRASLYVSDSPDWTEQHVGMSMYSLPEVIEPKTKPIEIKGVLLCMFDDAQIKDIEDCKLFVHFDAFIRYTDVYERRWRTGISRAWKISDSLYGMEHAKFGFWVSCGPEGETEDKNPY